MQNVIPLYNMKFTAIILLFYTGLSFAQNQEVSWDIISTSPKDHSILHHPETNILIKNRVKMNIADLKESYSFELNGSKSSNHKIDFTISNNETDLVLHPIRAFENNETVQLKIINKSSNELELALSFKTSPKAITKPIDFEENTTIENHRSIVPDYTITVNNNPWHGNLFFKVGGPPQKPDNIVDTSGNLLYSMFRPKKGFDWKVNLNNKITFFDRQIKAWFVMDEYHQVLDTVFCKNGFIADNHDFMALPNGHYILFAYDEQPYAMDTVVVGGDPNATVEGLIIQELDQNQNLLFQWRSWDHFHVLDNIYIDTLGNQFPFIHCNAIDLDFDGHFLISSRNLDEITKIHRTNGQVIWRWGGSQNEFNFINDYPFTYQHCIRSLGNNRYILYDNGNFSSPYLGGHNLSRGVEYLMDTSLMTVEKKWEFYHPDSLYGPATGSIQRLPNGNTLINWGSLSSMNLGAIVTEVDTNNQIVFQLECINGQNIYRAHKFDWFFDASIVGCTESMACNYDPNYIIDDSSCYFKLDSAYIMYTNNALSAQVNGGYPPYSYLWNTNETTQDITNLNSGMYWVVVNDMNFCYTDTLYYDLSSTGILEFNNSIIQKNFKIYNALGQEVKFKYNELQFHQFPDGRIRKKILYR